MQDAMRRAYLANGAIQTGRLPRPDPSGPAAAPPPVGMTTYEVAYGASGAFGRDDKGETTIRIIDQSR